MAYEVFSMLCRTSKHGEMDYIGKGNYKCPICGFEYHDDDYDDDGSSEKLSVYEAAEIWASHGKDEDYMFGYSEDELERAL
ncbi:MAG: hypothetical protein IJ292_03240 [Clostridia bacterium]|nr:hypothetical protein [Clostridia bacterium]